MPHFSCPYCGVDFYKRNSKAKYCSKSCSMKARHAAGNVNLKKGRKQKYSDQEMVDALQALSKRLGKTPSKRDLESIPDMATEWSYRTRFGTWNNALIAAGLTPHLQYPPKGYNKCIKPRLRFRVLKRDGFICRYCGGTPDNGYLLVVDHVIPRKLGGKTNMKNLVTSCWVCNSGKSDKSL